MCSKINIDRFVCERVNKCIKRNIIQPILDNTNSSRHLFTLQSTFVSPCNKYSHLNEALLYFCSGAQAIALNDCSLSTNCTDFLKCLLRTGQQITFLVDRALQTEWSCQNVWLSKTLGHPLVTEIDSCSFKQISVRFLQFNYQRSTAYTNLTVISALWLSPLPMAWLVTDVLQ